MFDLLSGVILYVCIMFIQFRVTREHRENLAKNTKTLCDKTKDKLKDIQNRYVRDLKKAKSEHSEDLVRNVQDTVRSYAPTSQHSIA